MHNQIELVASLQHLPVVQRDEDQLLPIVDIDWDKVEWKCSTLGITKQTPHGYESYSCFGHYDHQYHSFCQFRGCCFSTSCQSVVGEGKEEKSFKWSSCYSPCACFDIRNEHKWYLSPCYCSSVSNGEVQYACSTLGVCSSVYYKNNQYICVGCLGHQIPTVKPFPLCYLCVGCAREHDGNGNGNGNDNKHANDNCGCTKSCLFPLCFATDSSCYSVLMSCRSLSDAKSGDCEVCMPCAYWKENQGAVSICFCCMSYCDHPGHFGLYTPLLVVHSTPTCNFWMITGCGGGSEYTQLNAGQEKPADCCLCCPLGCPLFSLCSASKHRHLFFSCPYCYSIDQTLDNRCVCCVCPFLTRQVEMPLPDQTHDLEWNLFVKNNQMLLTQGTEIKNCWAKQYKMSSKEPRRSMSWNDQCSVFEQMYNRAPPPRISMEEGHQ